MVRGYPDYLPIVHTPGHVPAAAVTESRRDAAPRRPSCVHTQPALRSRPPTAPESPTGPAATARHRATGTAAGAHRRRPRLATRVLQSSWGIRLRSAILTLQSPASKWLHDQPGLRDWESRCAAAATPTLPGRSPPSARRCRTRVPRRPQRRPSVSHEYLSQPADVRQPSDPLAAPPLRGTNSRPACTALRAVEAPELLGRLLSRPALIEQPAHDRRRSTHPRPAPVSANPGDGDDRAAQPNHATRADPVPERPQPAAADRDRSVSDQANGQFRRRQRALITFRPSSQRFSRRDIDPQPAAGTAAIRVSWRAGRCRRRRGTSGSKTRLHAVADVGASWTRRITPPQTRQQPRSYATHRGVRFAPPRPAT